MLGRRAYTFGDSYLAEVDIVLPASMSVAESHDIAEELQVCVHAQRFHGCLRFSIALPACFIATTMLHLICLFMRPSWVQWMAWTFAKRCLLTLWARLQIKLERLPDIARAFVHIDYETSHEPEHKIH